MVGIIAGWIVMLILFVVSEGFGAATQGASQDLPGTAVQIVGVLAGGFVTGIIGGAITGIVLDVLLSNQVDLPVRQPPWWNILLRLAIVSPFIGWAVGMWVAS